MSRATSRGFASLLFAGVLLAAGCIAAEPSTPAPLSRVGGPPPTVVALIDSGINPYHAAFRAVGSSAEAGSLAEAIAHAGVDVTRVALTLGTDFRSDHERDAAFWHSTEPGVLYAFEGTRALGISFLDPIQEEYEYIVEPSAGHGTGTSSLAAREDANVIVVALEVYGYACLQVPTLSCFDHPSSARAMEWIAAQPWIDVVSVSMAMPANAPPPPDASPELRRYLEASRAAAASGKLLVFGSGNSVAPPFASHYNGPPWVIAAGGAEFAKRGESVAAGRMPDVVANFTDLKAQGGTYDEYATASGTSYSTPIVAGTLARALSEIRAALGHEGGLTADGVLAVGRAADGRELRVTSRDLRAALNASAAYFAATEWDPTADNGYGGDAIGRAASSALPVVAPAAQMGWGFVHGGLASEVARRVLEGDYALPAEKLATEPSMRAQYDARSAYWGSAGSSGRSGSIS